jgi:hypothetical protein
MSESLAAGIRISPEITSTVAASGSGAVPGFAVATTNAPSGAGLVGVGDIPGLSNGVPTAAAGDPPLIVPMASNALASTVSALVNAPVLGTVFGSTAPQQSASEHGGDLGGSFVNLESSLTQSPNLGGVLQAPGIALPFAVAQIDLSMTGYQARSSSAPAAQPNAGQAAIIDWGSNRISALDQLGTVSSKETSDWLDDFLNHLGQTELQRNPNAGIRVRPASTSASA